MLQADYWSYITMVILWNNHSYKMSNIHSYPISNRERTILRPHPLEEICQSYHDYYLVVSYDSSRQDYNLIQQKAA